MKMYTLPFLLALPALLVTSRPARADFHDIARSPYSYAILGTIITTMVGMRLKKAYERLKEAEFAQDPTALDLATEEFERWRTIAVSAGLLTIGGTGAAAYLKQKKNQEKEPQEHLLQLDVARVEQRTGQPSSKPKKKKRAAAHSADPAPAQASVAHHTAQEPAPTHRPAAERPTPIAASTQSATAARSVPAPNTNLTRSTPAITASQQSAVHPTPAAISSIQAPAPAERPLTAAPAPAPTPVAVNARPVPFQSSNQNTLAPAVRQQNIEQPAARPTPSAQHHSRPGTINPISVAAPAPSPAVPLLAAPAAQPKPAIPAPRAAGKEYRLNGNTVINLHGLQNQPLEEVHAIYQKPGTGEYFVQTKAGLPAYAVEMQSPNEGQIRIPGQHPAAGWVMVYGPTVATAAAPTSMPIVHAAPAAAPAPATPVVNDGDLYIAALDKVIAGQDDSAVGKLAGNNHNINARAASGMTALLRAIELERPDLVNTLLTQGGANPFKKGIVAGSNEIDALEYARSRTYADEGIKKQIVDLLVGRIQTHGVHLAAAAAAENPAALTKALSMSLYGSFSVQRPVRNLRTYGLIAGTPLEIARACDAPEATIAQIEQYAAANPGGVSLGGDAAQVCLVYATPSPLFVAAAHGNIAEVENILMREQLTAEQIAGQSVPVIWRQAVLDRPGFSRITNQPSADPISITLLLQNFTNNEQYKQVNRLLRGRPNADEIASNLFERCEPNPLLLYALCGDAESFRRISGMASQDDLNTRTYSIVGAGQENNPTLNLTLRQALALAEERMADMQPTQTNYRYAEIHRIIGFPLSELLTVTDGNVPPLLQAAAAGNLAEVERQLMTGEGDPARKIAVTWNNSEKLLSLCPKDSRSSIGRYFRMPQIKPDQICSILNALTEQPVFNIIGNLLKGQPIADSDAFGEALQQNAFLSCTPNPALIYALSGNAEALSNVMPHVTFQTIANETMYTVSPTSSGDAEEMPFLAALSRVENDMKGVPGAAERYAAVRNVLRQIAPPPLPLTA